jgi:uncharacterized protein (TIGR03086 family)
MELITLHERAVEYWLARVDAVSGDQWDDPTPCTQWSVRDLVNHVAAEDLWAVPLLGGKTIQEVGSKFDGDVLGHDPVGQARAAAQEAQAVTQATVPGGGVVHLSYGEEDLGEYVRQLCAEHLIHGWDLAAATGGDTSMDDQLVADVAAWFAQREGMYRGAGFVSSRPSSFGDPQSDLLSAFGRTSQWGPSHAALASFSAAFDSGDVDSIMARMTQDCVFESTGPVPDGQRHEGQVAVRAAWVQLFAQTRDPKFTDEDVFVCGDRACVRWRFTWTNEDGSQGHVRGVDVMRFRDALVSEKLSYVKG